MGSSFLAGTLASVKVYWEFTPVVTRYQTTTCFLSVEKLKKKKKKKKEQQRDPPYFYERFRGIVEFAIISPKGPRGGDGYDGEGELAKKDDAAGLDSLREGQGGCRRRGSLELEMLQFMIVARGCGRYIKSGCVILPVYRVFARRKAGLVKREKGGSQREPERDLDGLKEKV